jgi:hypothetical protein
VVGQPFTQFDQPVPFQARKAQKRSEDRAGDVRKRSRMFECRGADWKNLDANEMVREKPARPHSMCDFIRVDGQVNPGAETEEGYYQNN